MYERGLWYLSGWVSVTFVYCVETAKDAAIVAMECE